MDIEVYKEAISNADLAFSNGKYENAVTWYDKALAEAPQDEYALSKAGTALVSMNKFDEAFGYFQRAVEADPENGDNVFNLANAYFFSGDIPQAIENYTKAEMLKCSDDVKARIYYQLALMCGIKQDYKSALINYEKYEAADPTGQAALDTDLIADKVNIYVQLEDFDNAIKYTLKWLNLSPAELRCYIIYFNLVMATEDFAKASSILDDAMKFAVNTPEEKYAVDLSRANWYVNAAGSSLDDGSFQQKAYDLMNELIVSEVGTPDQKNELVLALGEVCIAMNKIDEAIGLMEMLTEKPEEAAPAPAAPAEQRDLSPEEMDAMMTADMAAMEQKVASGEISEDIGGNVPVNYDENGLPVRDYPDGMFEDEDGFKMPELKGVDMEKLMQEDDEAEKAAQEEFRARVGFMLLTCYAYKEDYNKTLYYARQIKDTPNNVYYSFFGRYSEAFAMMQLAKKGEGFTKEEADRKYAQEISFFRSEMLKANENSAYALVFRTRMYAEQGKFTKAEELAELMGDSEKAALAEYIAQCKAELEKQES